MKPKIRPRNPFVALAKFRKAGAHAKPTKSLRRHEKQALAKAAKSSPESWHNRIAHQLGSAMALVTTIVYGGYPFDSNGGWCRCNPTIES